TFEQRLLAIERQMVEILGDDDKGKQAGARRAFAQGLLGLAGGGKLRRALLTAARTGVLVLDVVADKDRGWLIVELRRGFRAHLDTWPATGWTGALGLGQAVVLFHMGQVFRRRLATVAVASFLLGRWRAGGGGANWRRRGLVQIGEQQGLIRMEAFTLAAVEPIEQQVQTLLQLLPF